MEPLVIVLNVNNIYTILSLIVLIFLLVASISYFKINIAQRKKVLQLEELINKLENHYKKES